MQIVIIAVGKLKERYWREAQAEYLKRLSAYAQIQVHEVDHAAIPTSTTHSSRASEADVSAATSSEAQRLTAVLRDRDAIIAMDRTGRTPSSEAWSQQYQQLQAGSYGRLAFLIGGSHGLSPSLLQRATFVWSFGPATFPHELARIILLEQLYRGEKILRGEPYHK